MGSSYTPPPSRPAAIPAPRPRTPQPRIAHENRVLLLALAAGLSGVLPAMIFLWTADYSARTQWTLTLFIVGGWLSFAFGVRSTVVRPLQTLANMQAAIREGDFSIRVRAKADDALGELMREVNALAETLREQRLGAMEASALLSTVMSEIEVAVFTFDTEHR